NSAFSGCNKIEEITLNNLRSIGDYAFYNCRQIKKIISQNYLSSIGNNAFYNCNNLVNLQINEQTSKGTNSFFGCTKLDLSFNIDLNNINIETHFGLNSQNFPDKFKEIKIDNSKIGYDEKNRILDLTSFDLNNLNSRNTLLLFSQQIKLSSNKILEEVILPRSENINSIFKDIFSSLTINKLTWNAKNVKNFNKRLDYYFDSTTINSIDENFCVGMDSIPDSAFSNQLRNQKKINLMNVRNISNYAFLGINVEFINTQTIKTIGNKSFSNRCKFNIPPNVQLEDDSFTTNWKELNNKDIVREQIFSNSDKFSQIYDQTTKTLDFTKITIYSPSDYENLKKYENISLYLLDGDVELLILPKIYNLTNDLYSNLGTISNIKFQNENQIIIKNSFNNTTILNKPLINETRIMLDEDAFFN
ncbi:MAG: leucine-rich repeat protein, partial [Mycoplasmataceae bacterium]|nr:leucine-rich repeat protein [Mycoplasmataceae bacterium]